MSTNTSEITKCAICFTSTKLRCSQCKVWFFCSDRCSRFFWPVHKHFCPFEFSPDVFTFPPLSEKDVELRRRSPGGLDIALYRNEEVFQGTSEDELIKLLTTPPSSDNVRNDHFGAIIIAHSAYEFHDSPLGIESPVEFYAFRLASLLRGSGDKLHLPLGRLSGGGKGSINVFARRYLVISHLSRTMGLAMMDKNVRKKQFVLECAKLAVPALNEAILNLPPLLLAKAKRSCDFWTACLDQRNLDRVVIIDDDFFA